MGDRFRAVRAQGATFYLVCAVGIFSLMPATAWSQAPKWDVSIRVGAIRKLQNVSSVPHHAPLLQAQVLRRLGAPTEPAIRVKAGAGVGYWNDASSELSPACFEDCVTYTHSGVIVAGRAAVVLVKAFLPFELSAGVAQHFYRGQSMPRSGTNEVKTSGRFATADIALGLSKYLFSSVALEAEARHYVPLGAEYNSRQTAYVAGLRYSF